MALPKLNYALFDITIPSTQQSIKIRQMIARDEKLLLMAKASVGPEVSEDILNAVRQVVNNCIVTPGIDVDKLALFDIEYLFLKLRALSVSNIIKVAYQDNQEVADWQEAIKTNPKLTPPAPYSFEINLDKVEIKFPEDRSKEIIVGDGIIITMKYPDSTLYTDKEFKDAQGKTVMDLILLHSIANIKQGTEIFEPAAGNSKELIEFLDSLPVPVYDKIRLFIANLPTLYYEIVYQNKMGRERKIVLTTLSDFFMF